MNDDTSKLTQLGSQHTQYETINPHADMLEVFDNRYAERDYCVRLEFPEFTSLCPKTGQPDFAVIEIEYIPDRLCIETKSLKLYFFAFRNHGSFMESITNKILSDIILKCQPRWCKVTATFNPRGGIGLTAVATYEESDDENLEILEYETTTAID